MRILLTGGAGFIGFHVAKALLERGDSVVIIDNFNKYYNSDLKEDRIRQLPKKNLSIHRIDITDYEKLQEVFKEEKFDKICHLAAQAGVRYSLTNPFKYELTNNLGTLNLLELAKNHKINHFVFASSSSVYGANEKMPFSEKDMVDSPLSLYAATKKTNELYAHVYHKLYGINCTGLRFFTVYGPWGRPDMALFKFVYNILHDKEIEVYNNGQMKRNFTFVSDITEGIISSIDNPFPYEILNLGGTEPVELNYFISCIEKELGKKAKKKMMPLQQGDVPATIADISKAKRLIGFGPKITIDDGIKRFISWYKEHDGEKYGI